MSESLEDLRNEIDQVDHQIVEALNSRAQLSQRVGQFKSDNGDPVFAPSREAGVIKRAIELSDGTLPDDVIADIFRKIMASSRALQRLMRVAYLGPELSFSHKAAGDMFDQGGEYMAARSISEIFRLTRSGDVEYGVVPIENTIGGTVGDSIDSFVEGNVVIISEFSLQIIHNLMSHSDITNIHTVYSHPQALAQCNDWLSKNLPTAQRVEVASTSAAAIKAANEAGSAAIGLDTAAKSNSLKLIRRGIQDVDENYTRFFLIGRQPNPPSGDDQTAICFAVADRIGALHDVLGIMRNHHISLSNMQSRPARGRSQEQAGDYVFYAEFPGHEKDNDIADALNQVKSLCTMTKVLGSWPIDRSLNSMR